VCAPGRRWNAIGSWRRRCAEPWLQGRSSAPTSKTTTTTCCLLKVTSRTRSVAEWQHMAAAVRRRQWCWWTTWRSRYLRWTTATGCRAVTWLHRHPPHRSHPTSWWTVSTATTGRWPCRPSRLWVVGRCTRRCWATVRSRWSTRRRRRWDGRTPVSCCRRHRQSTCLLPPPCRLCWNRSRTPPALCCDSRGRRPVASAPVVAGPARRPPAPCYRHRSAVTWSQSVAAENVAAWWAAAAAWLEMVEAGKDADDGRTAVVPAPPASWSFRRRRWTRSRRSSTSSHHWHSASRRPAHVGRRWTRCVERRRQAQQPQEEDWWCRPCIPSTAAFLSAGRGSRCCLRSARRRRCRADDDAAVLLPSAQHAPHHAALLLPLWSGRRLPLALSTELCWPEVWHWSRGSRVAGAAAVSVARRTYRPLPSAAADDRRWERCLRRRRGHCPRPWRRNLVPVRPSVTHADAARGWVPLERGVNPRASQTWRCEPLRRRRWPSRLADVLRTKTRS